MTTLAFRCWLILAFCFGPAFLQAQEKPQTETAKLEILFKNLERLPNAKFIRNGSSYDAKAASRFLLNKLQRHRGEFKTAMEFIEKHASASAEGKAYLIRFDDGREVKCRDYLAAELKKLDP